MLKKNEFKKVVTRVGKQVIKKGFNQKSFQKALELGVKTLLENGMGNPNFDFNEFDVELDNYLILISRAFNGEFSLKELESSISSEMKDFMIYILKQYLNKN